LASAALPELDLPVGTSRISDRVIAAWVGENAWSNQTIAVASKRGIVVIDTFSSWAYQERIRAAIEKEFGRSDYFAVINTHQHYDHTNGNQLYADLPIIAHQAARQGMISEMAGIPNWFVRLNRGIADMEERQKTLKAETREGKTNLENIAYWRAVIRDMEKGYVSTPPNTTFNDRMSLPLGDLTLDLYSFPGLHTKGDIIVHIPEEKVLCVGDMINDGWLPPLSKEAATDPAYLLQAWKEVLARGPDVKHVLPGHSYVKVSFETFKWRYDYFKTLWEGLIKAKKAEKSLDEVQAIFAFETVFPDQKDMIRKLPGRGEGQEVDVHAQNIEILWAALKN
jgi:glyoxylase-like metal-dependent hydrolase (beta-lactamase superfamily II)